MLEPGLRRNFMQAVNLRVAKTSFGDTLSDMRKWLDHHDCVPAMFEHSANDDHTILVHVEFRDHAMANAFRLAFADKVTTGPARRWRQLRYSMGRERLAR